MCLKTLILYLKIYDSGQSLKVWDANQNSLPLFFLFHLHIHYILASFRSDVYHIHYIPLKQHKLEDLS